jgi:gamma-glutamyltranspeptidase/glutathione hydrolase
MISTDHPLASQAGLDVYKETSSIVDAFVSSSLVISVVRPQSTGLGGGGFALTQFARDKKVRAFDFRERAPLGASPDMYVGREKESRSGVRSIATPGTISGLFLLHSRYGKAPRSKVFSHAKTIARDGFIVYKDLANSIKENYSEMDDYTKSIFSLNGRPIREGELLKQPDLLTLLELLEEKGESVFYRGQLAQAIESYMKENSGLINQTDLKKYQTFENEPLRISFLNLELFTMPPPSSGVYLFQILKLLESQNLKPLFYQDPALYYSNLIPAFQIGYKERHKYGSDPRFSNHPYQSFLSPEYIQALTEKESKESFNTTHISVIDNKGNSISSTQSINGHFGSKRALPGYGLIFNNTMDDFSTIVGKENLYGLVGTKVNQIEPGKTPLSSMSPIIAKKSGKVYFAIGAPGGSQIPTSIIQVILARHILKLGVKESISLSRIHNQFKPDVTLLETSFLKDISKLPPNSVLKTLHAKVFYVERSEEGIWGASDPRGDGIPLGY